MEVLNIRSYCNEEESTLSSKPAHLIATRFRGLLPVVIDVETSGLNPATDALLEIAAIPIDCNSKGILYPQHTYAYHIEPFQGARLDPNALLVTGIDPFQPLRYAVTELQAIHSLSLKIRGLLKKNQCHRAILVGHNAWFDLAFLNAAVKRCHYPHHPFHAFTTLDTATLGAVYYGETVLARAARAARIPFNVNHAHSAIYDAERTAELFCTIVNRMKG